METIDMSENYTELVVDPSRLESFLLLLGYELDDEGHIVSIETGEIAKSPDGEILTADEIGYLGADDDGNVEPVRDDFSAIVSYLGGDD